ncbi:MAG: MFS transporter [Gammaproteobacteria bacterium]|nr:MFS transporter [Gammaproteobacteria bacterium]
MKEFKVVSLSKNKNTIYMAYLGWFIVTLFYFYQYILRVAPGVLVTDLRFAFRLTADEFATLGSYYLYAYALFQIPLGFIVDCVGVRKTVLASITLCIAGAYLFSTSQVFWTLQLSRIMVGLGSACAFMCALKLVVDSFPMGKRGFLMGATLTLGTVGALVAGKPLALLSEAVGFRQAINDVAILGLFILIITFVLLPKPKKENLIPLTKALPKHLWASLLDVFKSRPIMLYAILAVAVYTPLSVLADLWGVAFLMQKYALGRVDAAKISMMMYLGLGIGCLTLPWLSEKYHYLNRSIRLSACAVLVLFGLLLYGPILSQSMLMVLLTLLGIFCGAEMLCFTGAGQYTHTYNVGITLGVVNTLNMLGGGLLQQLIGFGLDQFWDGKVDEAGLRMYTTANYTLVLSILMIVITICCLLSLRLPKDSVVKNKD